MNYGQLQLSSSTVIWHFEFRTGGHISAYLGNTLRGGFGKALRDTCCAFNSQECHKCLIGWRCVYGYVFESLRPPNAPVMRKYPHVPHPFVFHVGEIQPVDVSPGHRLPIGLTMIGRAQAFFPYFLVALLRLGEIGIGRDRAKFNIARVETKDGHVLYQAGRRSLGALPPPEKTLLTVRQGEVKELTIHLLTPLRLRTKGQVLRAFDFRAFISAFLRRLQLLISLHDPEGTFDLDVRGILEAAAGAQIIDSRVRWQDLERWSRRQRRKMPLGGLVGRVCVRADVGIFGGLLKLAEIVHVGRGTAFGLGQIRVEEDDQ